MLPSNAEQALAEPETRDAVPWWADLLASLGAGLIRATLWLLSAILDGVGQ